MSRPFVSHAAARHRSQAAALPPCPLTEPGILLTMVSPEQPETGAAPPAAIVPGLRLLGATAVGLGVGAFVAALVRTHTDLLLAGARMDTLAWRGLGWPWGLALVLGAAVGLAARTPAATAALRGLVVALGLAVAVTQGGLDLAPGALPWVHAAIAFSLGAVAGGSGSSLRLGAPWSVAGLAAFVGGGGAVAGIEYGSADLCGAVAIGACLVATTCLAPAATLRWRWSGAGLAGSAIVGAAALALTAPLEPAWLAAFLALALVGVAAGRVGILVGAAAAVAGAWWMGAGGPGVAGDQQLLARHGAAAVVYHRADQELRLLRDGRCVAAFGPDRSEGPLATALVTALARAGDRVLLLGAGAQRLALQLPGGSPWLLERLVDDRDLGDLPARLCGDGPVPPPAMADAPAAWRDVFGALTSLGAGSRQLLVVAEDALGAGVHRRGERCQHELRRVVGEGVVLQLLALDRAAPAALTALLDAAASAHPWNGLYLVGDGAVLVSGVGPPTPRGAFASWSDDARWALHAAHLGGVEDLDQAFAGVVKPAAAATAAADAVPDDLARVLLQRLEPASAPPTADSLLLRWLRAQSDQRRARARLLALPDDVAGRAEAQALSASFLPVGAPQPWLQAALALPDVDGGRLADPGRAVRAACALDPTFFDDAPAVLQALARPRELHGALEDLWQTGSGRRLAERCAGDGPLAIALRARFASRCARALVEALADGPLTTDQNLALRELADPFVLDEAARVVVPAGRWHELLGWWRLDLPVPAALRDVAAFAAEQRLRLAAALRGRREASSHLLLADLLLDEDLQVRQVAGEVLQQVADGAIPFDADWPRSERLDAAARLRELHNRRP